MLDRETACDSVEPWSELEVSGCEPGEDASSGFAILSPPRDCDRLRSPSIVLSTSTKKKEYVANSSKLARSLRSECLASSGRKGWW